MGRTVRAGRRKAGGASPGAAPPGSFLNAFYWSVPVLLTGVLWVVSSASMHQIRYEELAESIRNPFWLDHRFVYDGISSHVGWYGTLLVFYRLFGFAVFTAKFVRLGFHLIGLYCIAALLRRGLGALSALVPLILIG